jgi:Tfp pilus assembly protein PilE
MRNDVGRTRRAFTLAEGLIGLALMSLLMEVIVGLWSAFAGQERRVAVRGSLAVQAELVRRAFDRDTARVPSATLVDATVDRCEMELAEALAADGSVRLRHSSYRIRRNSSGVYIYRDGRVLAGPFPDAAFTLLPDTASGRHVQLTVQGTDPLTLLAHFPFDDRPAGLKRRQS